MTRDEAEQLLRLRWRLTDGKLTFNDEKVAAWHEALKPYDYGRLRARMTTRLVFELAELRAGIQPPEHPMPTHSPGGQQYIPWSDPRAQAAFRAGYRDSTGRDYAGGLPL